MGAIAFSLWSLTTLHVATMWTAQGPDKQGMEKHTGKMPNMPAVTQNFSGAWVKNQDKVTNTLLHLLPSPHGLLSPSQ